MPDLPGVDLEISTIKLVEKYETANWSLQQGDEEVNKRIKQKTYIFKQIAQYFGLKTNPLQGLNPNIIDRIPC